jgi:hypothetical protein
MNLYEDILRIKEVMGVIKESTEELFFVFDPSNGKIISFNVTSKDELNKVIYDENGYNRGYGYGLQLNDNRDEFIKFDSLNEVQQWYQKKIMVQITKETQNSKYPDLSSIALNLRKIDGLDYTIINRGSCFKFTKEISKLGYNIFTFIFSNEEQEVIHVYIKLNDNLYFDATGFHTKKEIKEEYINVEGNYMYDSDISELNYYSRLDTYNALSTIPINNHLWEKIVRVINNSK